MCSPFLAFTVVRANTRFVPTPVITDRFGEVLGSEKFFKSAIAKYNRRTRPTVQSKGTRRINEFDFFSIEQVIWEFERKMDVDTDKLDVSTHAGKRLRGELLVKLKDYAGLKYNEISELPAFMALSSSSLPKLYRDALKRFRKQTIKDTEKK